MAVKAWNPPHKSVNGPVFRASKVKTFIFSVTASGPAFRLGDQSTAIFIKFCMADELNGQGLPVRTKPDKNGCTLQCWCSLLKLTAATCDKILTSGDPKFQILTEEQLKEVLSVLMLCAPDNRRRPFSYHTKMADRVFSCFVRFLVKQIDINSEKCIEYGKQRQSDR